MFTINSEAIYDLSKIHSEVAMLVEEHGWHQDTQISLQSPDGNFHTGNGKIEWNPGYVETDFDVINTPDDWEITRFLQEENLYRSRIMKLRPKECYSWHMDRSPRVHLAVNTHPSCKMIVDDRVIHIPQDGRPYWVDTRLYHTAFNGKLGFERIHIVGCIKP